MYLTPLASIPDRFRRRYRILRALLYAVVIATVAVFALQVLFPTLVFSFNFRTPSSSKNNLFDPRSPDNAPRENGKIEAGGTLIADVSVPGNFSRARVAVTLEKRSAVPRTLEFSLRRSYRSFLLPAGDPITDFPQESLYKIEGSYYALRDGVLHPFVSEAAYLSRYPDDFALPETADFLARYPVSEEWLGFRIGSIVSFADGAFLIVSDTEMRPVGSADIFLAYGYHFEDVQPANEEEIGIYKRGRIFLLGPAHPDGTLLLDQDSNTYYLIDHGSKRPVLDARYRDFLLEKQTPIIASEASSRERVDCSLSPSLLGQTFSCTAPLNTLKPGFGNDFEISIGKSDTDMDINTLQVSFETAKNTDNMLLILSQIKQRLLTRFGVNQ